MPINKTQQSKMSETQPPKTQTIEDLFNELEYTSELIDEITGLNIKLNMALKKGKWEIACDINDEIKELILTGLEDIQFLSQKMLKAIINSYGEEYRLKVENIFIHGQVNIKGRDLTKLESSEKELITCLNFLRKFLMDFQEKTKNYTHFIDNKINITLVE